MILEIRIVDTFIFERLDIYRLLTLPAKYA